MTVGGANTTGIGTEGGSFEGSISENNWLGEGKKLDFNISTDSESLSGRINYTDPNYNFLGNSVNYFVSSTDNDKPDQGYENTWRMKREMKSRRYTTKIEEIPIAK
mgnify:CR=1 FL=1